MQLDTKMLKKWMIYSTSALWVCFFQSPLMAQNISPGALEPEREVPMLPDIVDDNIVYVPPVAARPVDADSGPVINVQKFVDLR